MHYFDPLMASYTFSDFLAKWGIYFWPAIFIIVIGLLLVYILAKVVKSTEYEAKFSFELNELFYAFFAVFITLSLLGTGESITQLTVTGTSLDTMAPSSGMQFKTVALARTIMAKFTVEMYSSMMDLYYLQTCYAVKNIVTKRNGEQVLSYGYKIFPGSDMFVSLISTLSLPLNMAYSSVSAQVILLHLIEILVIYLILPIGIFVRFVPGAYKQAGSFLLAFSVGVLIVFPMIYIFTTRGLLDIVTNFHPENNLFPLYTPGSVTLGMQCGFRQVVVGLITHGFTGIIGLISAPAVRAINFVLTPLFMTPFMELANPIIFWKISQYIGLTFVMAVFIPTLATILTTGFISAYSKFLMSM